MRLFLIGLRGSGKSSIGRLVAKRAKRGFIDLDDATSAHFDEPTISAIWAAHGESAWRAAELIALRDVLMQSDERIVALGGGTPMIDEAHALLLGEKSRGSKIIYLRCDVAELARRLEREPGDRPPITGRGPLEEIAQVYAERDPVYRSIANRVVDAGGSPEEVAEAILFG